MDEQEHLANFLNTRFFETGNLSFASALFSVRTNHHIDAPIMKEYGKYRDSCIDARSNSENFDERITITQGIIEKLILECFSLLKTFLIAFDTKFLVFKIKLVFETNVEVELKFSLFSAESKYFYSSFGKQMIRNLKSGQLEFFINHLFIAQKKLEIDFACLEVLWKSRISFQAAFNLLTNNFAINLKEINEALLSSRLEFFRILSGAGHLVSHCWENRDVFFISGKRFL